MRIASPSSAVAAGDSSLHLPSCVAFASDIRQCIPLSRCITAFQVLKAIAFLSLLKVSPLLDEVLESEPLFRVPAGTQGTLPLLHSRLHLWLASRRATFQRGHSLRLSSCSLKSRSSRRSSGGGGSTVRISRPGPVLLIHAADKDGIGKI